MSYYGDDPVSEREREVFARLDREKQNDQLAAKDREIAELERQRAQLARQYSEAQEARRAAEAALAEAQAARERAIELVKIWERRMRDEQQLADEAEAALAKLRAAAEPFVNYARRHAEVWPDSTSAELLSVDWCMVTVDHFRALAEAAKETP